MKIKVPTVIEEDIKIVNIMAAVNYGEEEIPNDFPGRSGDIWKAEIEIETGKIRNWPAGRSEKMHLTVKDCGTYVLINAEGKAVARRDADYVPHGVVPGNYGDVIRLDIAEDGTVTNWPRRPDVKDFFPED